MASGSNIGIMDQAYFVGRKEILAWLNDTYSLNLGKIEETASGAVACQIADSVFPGKVPLSKVKWGAKSDYEFVHNYKILQQVFAKMGVNKHVEVERLVRAKYQDNLEFMQWMKRWYELNSDGSDYDAVGRRSKAKGAPKKSTRPKGAASASGRTASGRAVGGSRAARGGGGGSSENSSAAANRRAPAAGGVKRNSKAEAALRGKLEDANAEVTELKLSVDGLEKERDFYFGKLRDIEILLQSIDTEPHTELTDQIFKILYATEDDFVVVDDEEGGDAAAATEGTAAGGGAGAVEVQPAAGAGGEEDLRDADGDAAMLQELAGDQA